MNRMDRTSSNAAASAPSRWILLTLLLVTTCMLVGGTLQPSASARSSIFVRGESYTTNEDRSLKVKAPGVLRNDRGTPDNLSATVEEEPRHGELKLSRNGSFTYIPDRNFSGRDSFEYRVRNGGSQSATGIAQIRVRGANDAPDARDDRYDTVQGEVLRVQPRGVLKNDSDPEGSRLTAKKVSNPDHGRLTLRQDGSFVYSPNPNYVGTDSFRYRAEDTDGKGGTATARISVASGNEAPNSPDRNFDLLEDDSRDVTLTATDSDGDDLTYRVTDQPENGTLTGTAPNLTYTPDADYNGDDSLTYTASDGEATDEGEISLDVTPVNDEPSFSIPDDTLNADEDAGEQTVQNFANRISRGPQNESGQSLAFSVTANTNPALFTEGPTISPDGTLTFTPAENEFGNATVTVRLQDNGGTANGGDDTSPEEQFTISINPVNDAPEVTVTNDGPIDEGESATITATVEDEEDDAITYTFDCDDDGSYEVLSSNENTTDCAFDDSGDQDVNVQVTDGTQLGNGSTTVTVNNVAPTATLSNDGPIDEGENVTVSFSGQSDPSTADTDAGFRYEYACDGSFQGDPAPNYETASTDASFSSCDFGQNGAKTIAARIIDKDGGSTTYTTEVTVNNVKPSVTLSGPEQVEESTTVERTYEFTVTDPGDDTFTVSAGFPKCGANGTFVDGSLVTDEDGGSFECLFPDGDATSNVEIKVTDSDGATDTDDQLVTVTIENVAPTVAITGDETALEGQTKTYSYTVSDPGEDPTPTVTESCGAANYIDTPAADSFDCTFPDGDGANGTTYEVEVTAGDGEEDGTGTKNVTVGNVAPEVTAAESQTADEGVSKTFDLGSFTDPGVDGAWNVTVDWGDDSTDTTFTMASPGDIADKDHTYTDDGDYDISVTVAEAGQDAPSDEATSSVDVANIAPVADDQSVMTDEGITKTITLTGDDVDADPLTFRITTLPANGKLFDGGTSGAEISASDLPYELSGDEVTYQPNSPSFFGPDSFDFTACDDANPAACDADGATVSISVSQFNDPPQANDDTKTTAEDTSLVFPASELTANDSAGPNEDAQTLTVISVQNAVNGTVSFANGQITFTPTADYNGSGASFEYTVRDNGQTNGANDFETDTGTVAVTVTEVNDAPTANDDPAQGKTYSVAEDSATALSVSAADGVLSNDTKGPSNESSQTLNATVTNDVDNGTLVLKADGSFEYTPDADYNGTDTFQYEACDDGTTNGIADEKCDIATATITVTAVNDDPNAVNDTATTDEDIEKVIDVLANDETAPDSGETLSVQSVSSPTAEGGTTTLITSGPNAGNVLYDPKPDYNGPDSFTYTISDGNGGTDAATVNVTVAAVNDAPVNTVPTDSFGGGTGSEISITGISISDVDAGNGDVEVNLSVTGGANSGALTLREDVDGGLVAADIIGNGSDDVVVTATLGEINATLSANDGLLYENAAEGSYTLTVETDDRGNTGSGGAKTDTDTVGIVIDAPPRVTSTNPANDATDVAPGGNIVVNFSENVNASASSFELECPDGTAKTVAVTGSGTSSVTLDPNSDLPGATTCQVRVIASQVTDTDANDPPNEMAADFNFSFTTAARATNDDFTNFSIVGNVSFDSANRSPSLSVLDNDEKLDSTTVTSSSATSAQGGNVNVRANGTFTYNPPAGYEGNDTFTYTVSGGSTATVTMKVENMIWFVNENATTSGDGRLSSPFTTLSAFNSVNNGNGNNPAANDDIYLYESPDNYTGGVTLLSGQKLIGQDTNDALSAILGFNRPSGSPDFPQRSNTNATKTMIVNASGNGITLGEGNVIRGLTVGNTSGSGIRATNVNNATMGADVAVSGTNGGAAVDLRGGNGTINYNGTVSNTAGTAIFVQNRSGGTTTFGGDINSTGRISVDGNSGGTTVNFSGATKKLNTGPDTAVLLSSGLGTAINFTNGGLDIDTTSGIGFSSSGGSTVTVQTGANPNTIDSTGKALDLAGTNVGTNGITFASVSSGGGTDNVSLANVGGGAVSMNGGALSGASQRAVNVSGGNSNITYAGTISNSREGIRVADKSGGTVNFSGNNKTLNTGANPAVTLDNNDAGTVRFTNGGLGITTTSGTGFNAVNGATAIEVSGSNNTISTTTGAALNVASTNIGPANLTFKTINVNGATNGIILNSTGSSGGLKVTGDGSGTGDGNAPSGVLLDRDGSGGTIQNTSTSGASLTDTRNVQLNQMNFTNANSVDGGSAGVCDNATNSGCNGAIKLANVNGIELNGIELNGTEEMGIKGVNVTNLDIVNSRILRAGDERHENGISIYGLYGNALNTGSEIYDTTVRGDSLSDDTVFIRNTDRTSGATPDKLTVTGSSFVDPGSSNELGDGIFVSLRNAANFETDISGSTFTQSVLRNGADGVQVDAGDESRSNVSITNSTFDGVGWNQAAVLVGGSGTSTTTYNVSDNPLVKGGVGLGILALVNGDGATVRGTIDGNTVTTTEPGNSGSGIAINAEASGDRHIASVTNNTVTGFAAGLSAYARESAQTDLTLTGNRLTAGTAFPIAGAMLDAGNGESGESPRLCVNFGSTPTNEISGTIAAGTDYLLSMYSSSTFQIQGLTGAGTEAANVNAFVSSRDVGGAVVDSQGGSATRYTNATCATP